MGHGVSVGDAVVGRSCRDVAMRYGRRRRILSGVGMKHEKIHWRDRGLKYAPPKKHIPSHMLC